MSHIMGPLMRMARDSFFTPLETAFFMFLNISLKSVLIGGVPNKNKDANSERR